MKKISLITLALAALAFCSCNEQKSISTKYNDWLYGVEYEDYDFEAATAAFSKYKPAAAGCSEVRKGNFIARNLDWYINRQVSGIVKVNGNGNRYASIGMAGCLPVYTIEFAQKTARDEETDTIYGIIPATTVDGINEKGLYIGVNVVPTGETSRDASKWNSGAWGLGAAFTNPDSDKTYCVTYLVRVVLDNAASVQEAIELIKSINWYEPSGFPSAGESQSFHWMVADANSNAVLEFIDNQLEVIYVEGEQTKVPSFGTIMTNFNNTLYSEGMLQYKAAGVERYNILNANYDAAEESVEGIKELIKKVWYTQAYSKDIDSEDFWCTEYVNGDFHAEAVYGNNANIENEAFRDLIKRGQAKFNDKTNWHSDESTLWYSTHTSVYDIEKRQLNVLVHEGLDGQQEWVCVDLNSTFAKPLAQ